MTTLLAETKDGFISSGTGRNSDLFWKEKQSYREGLFLSRVFIVSEIWFVSLSPLQ